MPSGLCQGHGLTVTPGPAHVHLRHSQALRETALGRGKMGATGEKDTGANGLSSEGQGKAHSASEKL